MSELINKNDNRAAIRWKLLTGASVLALTAYIASPSLAEDRDKPIIWVELGGQLERIDSAQTLFAPSFVDTAPSVVKTPIILSQHQSPYAFGGEGRLVFAPEDSNWVFSAAIRYGRSNGRKHLHQEAAIQTPTHSGNPITTSKVFFGDGQTKFREAHDILDFQAGRNVGLGLLGPGSSSTISAGVRFAHFNSSSHITLHGRPYLHLSRNIKYQTFPGKYNRHAIDYTAALQAERSTQAVGPSLSWVASVPLVSSGEQETIDFDWGINGSVLFGRQKSRVHHQTSAYHYNLRWFEYYYNPQTSRSTQHADHNRARKVTIPNIGGFAGISLKFPNAKVSLGYRADFFIDAMDNGIDARKSTTLGFHGPYISISIGLGDQ